MFTFYSFIDFLYAIQSKEKFCSCNPNDYGEKLHSKASVVSQGSKSVQACKRLEMGRRLRRAQSSEANTVAANTGTTGEKYTIFKILIQSPQMWIKLVRKKTKVKICNIKIIANV